MPVVTAIHTSRLFERAHLEAEKKPGVESTIPFEMGAARSGNALVGVKC